MQIFIKDLIYGSETFKTIITIPAEPSDSIEDVKCKIQDKIGIPPNKQILKFKSCRLNDDNTLAYYYINDLSTLDLYPKYEDFFCYIIYDEGKKLKLNLNNICFHSSKTLFLKEKIKEELGIEAKYQLLTIDGKIMNDDESLESNLVSNGKEIQLKIIMSVNEFLMLTSK